MEDILVPRSMNNNAQREPVITLTDEYASTMSVESATILTASESSESHVHTQTQPCLEVADDMCVCVCVRACVRVCVCVFVRVC